jgi:hypothetical protein
MAAHRRTLLSALDRSRRRHAHVPLLYQATAGIRRLVTDWDGTSGGRGAPPTARRDAAGAPRTAAGTAGSLEGARADGPGESRTRRRSHGPVPRRGRTSVRVSLAGRTVRLRLAGVPEHLAERQIHEYCDHGPDEETARDPQDPRISSKAPGRRVLAARSRLAWMWVAFRWTTGVSTAAECHASGDGSRTTAPRGCKR